METIEEKLFNIVVEIKKANEAYFNESKPELSDSEYDSLFEECKKLTTEIKELIPDSEVVKHAEEILYSVGAPVSESGKRVKHSMVMGSLNKVNNIDDLKKWWGKIYSDIIVTEKIDGLAIKLCYEKGDLIQAATRGNGEYGIDVTDNIREIKDIPKRIDIIESIELRGEIYMLRSDFEKFSGGKYSNPRNTASGSVMQKDSAEVRKRPLKFFCYDVKGKVFENELDKYNFCNKIGVKFVNQNYITFDMVERYIKSYEEEIRKTLDYDIDGLVFSTSSCQELYDLGSVSNRPVGKMAFKFKPEKAKTIVENIVWQVGRLGRITPVAEITPVKLQGGTIRNVTLHNLKRVQDIGIGVGSEIIIERAGDIIPQVVSVLTKNPCVYPISCPICGMVTEKDEVNLFCNNEFCGSKLENNIVHYLKTLDIKGISNATIAALIEAGLIKGLPDIYYLDYNRIRSLSQFGDTSAKNIVDSILEKSEVELHVFLAALGINNLGKTVGRDLAKKFKTLEKVRNANLFELSEIGGIGEVVAKDIRSGLNKLTENIDKILQCIEVKEVVEKSGKLSGKCFCCTGTLTMVRREVHKIIEESGGHVMTSVNKDLDYLIAGDDCGSKLDKAKRLGVKIISEKEFTEML